MLLWLSLVSTAQAEAIEAPELMLERITRKMLHELKAHETQTKENPEKLVEIINKILVPYIDAQDMARWVAGRTAWLKASTAEQEAFVTEFRELLIRTYASTLQAYTNQVIQYLPPREAVTDKARVQITSLVHDAGRAPVTVNYRLVRKADNWQVYDLAIEGVSLLRGFKAQFSADIQQQGLAEVTKKMKNHNQKPLH